MSSEEVQPGEAVVDWAPGVVWEYDPARAAFTYVSPSAELLLGYPAQEWLAPHFWEERLHPADRANAMNACREAFERGAPHTLEYRLVARSGREVHIIDQASSAQLGERTVIRGLMLDVSQLGGAREEQTRRTLRTALESFDGIFVVLRPDGSVDRIFGADVPERVSQHGRLEDLLGELREEDKDSIAAALRGEQRRFERTSSDGRRLLLSVRPLAGSEHREAGALLTVRDVTAERRPRTPGADSERLADLGLVAASIAHELRNPLAYATASISFLDAELRAIHSGKRPTPETVAELISAVTEVKEGIEHIRHISSGLIGDPRAADEAPCELAAVISRAVRFVSPWFRDPAAIVCDVAEGLRAPLSSGRLQQVFVNLLMNAQQAAGPRVAVRIAAATNGEWLSVTVEDDGPGVPADVLPRIFDRFFTTKPLGVGTGLGLAICRDIITSAGGKLSVENLPERGARFRIELPREA